MPRPARARFLPPSPRPSSRLAAGLLPVLPALLAALPGCRLVDQRTFERAGLTPARPQLAASDFASRAQPLPPLAVVRFGANDDDWRGPLVAAARAAQARRADVQFDVVSPIPLAAPPAVQDEAARTGAGDAATVALALQADGVAPEAIHLGQRGDRGNPPRQVEVYVR